eukprot:gene21601-28601_t
MGNDMQLRIQTISWKPRAFVYHNFLSHSEAAHIISLASPQMKRSTVVGGPNSTDLVVDNLRTSAGTFLDRNQDSVISAIEQRLAVWSQVPPSHQEGLQVLRYGPTNKYGPHTDGFMRVISVLIYFVAPEEGGETAFPMSDAWLHKEMATQQGNLSSCAQGHVAYKPKVGDALMFYDMDPTYTETDSFAQHTGCPVLKGVKWNAVKWIHGAPYRESDWEDSLKNMGQAGAVIDPGMCIDLDPKEYGFLKDRVLGEFERNKEELRKEERKKSMIPFHRTLLVAGRGDSPYLFVDPDACLLPAGDADGSQTIGWSYD